MTELGDQIRNVTRLGDRIGPNLGVVSPIRSRFVPSEWDEEMRQLDKHHTINATNQHSRSTKRGLYGGVGQILFTGLSERASDPTVDHTGLGRWVSTLCSGKAGIKTRIVTGYRPFEDKTGNTGAVFSQHEQYFKDSEGSLIGPSKTKHRNPRDAFLEDLDADMVKWLEAGEQIILAMDANENIRTEEMPKWAR